jgi:hypothetical protein
MSKSLLLSLIVLVGWSIPSIAQAQCGAGWTLGTSSGPGGYEICFDEARQRTVIVAGPETLEWDGVSWTVKATGGPPERGAAGLVYDPIGQRCLLFGGYSSQGARKDLWAWNGQVWTQLASAPADASGRGDFAMAFDRGRNKLVIHGGYPGSGGLLQDTLEWNGATNTWQRWATGAIGNRYAHRMAYDEARGQLILHGGYYFTNKNDTWTWNGSAWTQLSTSGPARYVFGMTYDSARQRIVLHGGTTCCGEVEYGQTWTWNGTTWSQCPLTGPARGYINIAYDRTRDVIVVPGGMGPTPTGRAYIPETWELAMSMQPSTRRVPQDYASIQSAVNAAIAGDTVLVAPGVYQESVNLSGKSIVVKAEQVHGATIQAPAGQRSVVATTSEPAAAKVIGMRLAGPGNDVIGGGAAVNSAVTFDACLFENCRHDTGGGALVNGGTPTFLTCDFQRCHAIGAPTAYGGGGAIRVVGATTTIERCEFLECTSGQNAAVLMNEGGGSVVVREATIVGDPTDTQTQMYNASGSLTVEQSLFESGKGVAVFGWAPYTIRDTVVRNLNGAAVFDMRYGTSVVERCSIQHCDVTNAICAVTYSGVYSFRDTTICASSTPVFAGPWIDQGGNDFNANCPCTLDLDGDGIVNGRDLAVVLSSWEVGPGSGPGDVSGDGDTDAVDLAVILANWGSCSQ